MGIYNYNIIFKSNEKLYNFCEVVIECNDGSSYIILKRKDKSLEHTTTALNAEGDIIKQSIIHKSTKPRSKQKKISYHTTGLVKYHDLDSNAFLCQPLYEITCNNNFLLYSIPSIMKLDEIKNYNEKKTKVIELDKSELEKRYTFSFIVSPFDCKYQINPLFSINVPAMYNLSCHVIEYDNDFIRRNKEKFIHIAPCSENQEKLLSDEEVELGLKKYYQKKFNVKGSIFLPSNSSGCFRIIFDVPMRVKPEIIYEFVSNKYSLVECDGCSNREVRFKIKYKSQNYIYLDCFKSLSFSAEL